MSSALGVQGLLLVVGCLTIWGGVGVLDHLADAVACLATHFQVVE